MRVGQAFPSKYLQALDLGDANVTVTIKEIRHEMIGQQGEQDEKLVIYFEGKTKGMVCNVTNANTIADVLGSDEMDDWPGSQITIYATEVEFKGKQVLGIRVRLRTPPPPIAKPLRKPLTYAKPAVDLTPPDGGQIPDFDHSQEQEQEQPAAKKTHGGSGPNF